MNSSAQLWHFISQYLTEHEVQRFVSLRNVNTGECFFRDVMITFD